MFTEVAVYHKKDIPQNPHLLYNGQKPDISLPKAYAAADYVNDKMCFKKVILDHGQMERVRGVASLAVGYLYGPVDIVAADF